jgi:rapamycin-insensitive companion of mTOR
MVGLPGNLSSSATPTQKGVLAQQNPPPSRSGPNYPQSTHNDRDGLQPPRADNAGRSMSAVSGVSFGPRGASLAPSGAPGSFSSALRSTATSRTGTPGHSRRISFEQGREEATNQAEVMLTELKERLKKEQKIKEGSENMLEALNHKKLKQGKEQRLKVEEELNSSNRKISELKSRIEQLQLPSTENELPGRLASLFRGEPLRAPSRIAPTQEDSDSEEDPGVQSPTFVMSNILQSLERDGQAADYYVNSANTMVSQFKNTPTLKYDLEWGQFGERVQTLLLSDSKEVVAAAYRMTRYAITDRHSLQNIRALHTDHVVILSLVKEGKDSVEREQALKFVRAFLDVKEGVTEVSRAIVRTIVAIAEHHEDRLRGIAIETLAEIRK